MALVGYARVSSSGQSLDVQLDKLKHCDKIYQETQSGNNQQRSQLAACLEYVRDGDTLIVSRLDRVARSTLHLCTTAEDGAQASLMLSSAKMLLCRFSTKILIRLMLQVVCFLICWLRSLNLKLNSALSVS